MTECKVNSWQGKSVMPEIGSDATVSPLLIFKHSAFWASLLVGAAIVVFQCLMNPNIGADTIRFLVPMQNLFNGKGYTINGEVEWFFSPGYGLLAALPYLIMGDLEYAGMLVSALSYLWIVGCAIYIGMRYFNEGTGILAGFFTSMFPMLVNLSYVTLADVPYTAFLMTSLALFLKVQTECSKKLLFTAVLGGMMGLGCLIRPDLLLIALAVSGMMLIQGVIESSRSGRIVVKDFVTCSTLVLVFFLVVLPYMIFLYLHTGIFTVSTKLGLAVIGGSDIVPHWTLNSAPDPILYIYSHLNEVYIIIKRNVIGICLQLVVSMLFVTIPLGLLWFIYPFIAGRKVIDYMNGRGRLRQTILAFAVFLIPLVSTLLFDIWDRYIIPYLTLMIPILSYLLNAFLTGVIGVVNKKKLSLFLLSIVVSWFMLSVIPVPRWFDGYRWNIVKVMQDRHVHLAHRAAGLWLYEEGIVPEQLSIIAPSKAMVVLFYAAGKSEPKGRSYSFIGLKTLNDLLKIMEDEHIEYLFIDRHYGVNNEISNAIWRDNGLAYKNGLKLVHSVEGLYQIYRFM